MIPVLREPTAAYIGFLKSNTIFESLKFKKCKNIFKS